MKRISIMALSFFILPSVAFANTEEYAVPTSSASTTLVIGAATTSGEIIIQETPTSTDVDVISGDVSLQLSVLFSEKIEAIKKQFDAYIFRLDLLNKKIRSNADTLTSLGLDTEPVLITVAESNSALENARLSMEVVSSTNLDGITSIDEILVVISKTKNELDSARDEIRKAQEKGKIAVSELKLLVLE